VGDSKREQVSSRRGAARELFVSGAGDRCLSRQLGISDHCPPRRLGIFFDELYFMACAAASELGLSRYASAPRRCRHGRRERCRRSPLADRFPTISRSRLVLSSIAIVRPSAADDSPRPSRDRRALLPHSTQLWQIPSMHSIEPLLWMGCAMIVIRMIQTGE